jgi:hypothetical protein
MHMRIRACACSKRVSVGVARTCVRTARVSVCAHVWHTLHSKSLPRNGRSDPDPSARPHRLDRRSSVGPAAAAVAATGCVGRPANGEIQQTADAIGAPRRSRRHRRGG